MSYTSIHNQVSPSTLQNQYPSSTTRGAVTHYSPRSIETSPRALVTLQQNSDRRSVEAALQRLGYMVRATNDSEATEVLLRTYEPDIMVMDINEAYPQSSELLQQVRRCPDIHTVVIGADTHDQRIIILRNGADDALPTEVSPDEVAMRCVAVLRRHNTDRSGAHGSNPRVLYFGPLILDLGRREMRVDHHVIPATRLEFDLFAFLCQRPLEVCRRSDLLTGVWGPHWVGDTHVVDVHLSNLRRKLDEHRRGLQFIKTVRGVGFRLADELLLVASEDLASHRQLEAHRDDAEPSTRF